MSLIDCQTNKYTLWARKGKFLGIQYFSCEISWIWRFLISTSMLYTMYLVLGHSHWKRQMLASTPDNSFKISSHVHFCCGHRVLIAFSGNLWIIAEPSERKERQRRRRSQLERTVDSVEQLIPTFIAGKCYSSRLPCFLRPFSLSVPPLSSVSLTRFHHHHYTPDQVAMVIQVGRLLLLLRLSAEWKYLSVAAVQITAHRLLLRSKE